MFCLAFGICAVMEQQDYTSLEADVDGNVQRGPPAGRVAVHAIRRVTHKKPQDTFPTIHDCQMNGINTILCTMFMTDSCPMRQQRLHNVLVSLGHSKHQGCTTFTVLLVEVDLLF